MAVNIQTIKDIRNYLLKELLEIYSERDILAITNIVIKSVTGIEKLHQLYMPEKNVNSMQTDRIIDICNQLKTGKPYQYVLGETVFYDCNIRVNNATLIPRPETEELVNLIIKENKDYTGNIIDIGSGSGCIAIALAANLPASVVMGFDISEEAVRIAKKNALLNGVTVSFFRSDIFAFDSEKFSKLKIIVSNPPYVRDSEKKDMSRNILDFEPHTALFVKDSDPLIFYRAILDIAERILLHGGKVYFEINEAMGVSMIRLLESHKYSGIAIIKDLNCKDRIIRGTKDV